MLQEQDNADISSIFPKDPNVGDYDCIKIPISRGETPYKTACFLLVPPE